MADLEEQYRKEKKREAKYKESRYRMQYVWWLELKVEKLQKELEELKNEKNIGD